MADEVIHASQRKGEGHRVALSTRLHAWTADMHASDALPEPAGPDPFAQLLGSLASCMAMTVRLYADRKSWPLDAVLLEVRDDRAGDAAVLERVRVAMTLEGELTDEQRARIMEISQRCPVHRTLAPSVEIETTLAD